MTNQHPELAEALRPQINAVKAQLAMGASPSAIANELHAQGLGTIALIVVFHEATGASLGDLKSFGQWWGAKGVTDSAAFDDWAAKVFVRQRRPR